MKRGSWGWWSGRAKESQSSEIQTSNLQEGQTGVPRPLPISV